MLAAGYAATGPSGEGDSQQDRPAGHGTSRSDDLPSSQRCADALRPVDGGTALAVVLRTLAAVPVERVVVVLGEDAALVRQQVSLAGVSVVELPEPAPMIASIRAGLEALPDAAGALVWPVDRALVAIKTVRALIEAHANGARIAVPLCALPDEDEGKRGHPVIFDRRLFDALRSAPDSEGAAAVVHSRGAEVVEVPVEDRGILVDIASPSTQAFLSRMRAVAKQIGAPQEHPDEGPAGRRPSQRKRTPRRPQ